MPQVTLYTDGACRGNPGIGGWGCILVAGVHRKALSGATLTDTTNNRMELTAVIEGLRALKKPCAITLVSDSKYVCQGIDTWLAKWKRNQWRTASKQSVANRDLWQALDVLLQAHTLSACQWVKGHDGHAENEEADGLANAAIDAALEGAA